MPMFEITVTSGVGSIGPFEGNETTVEGALIAGRRAADAFLGARLSTALTRSTWIVAARDPFGKVVETTPFITGG
jgi:hypothetical protein